MNDQDLLADMRELAEAEDALKAAEHQAQIESQLHVQGQVVALVAVLVDKGVLTKSDIHVWEKRAEGVTKSLQELVAANSKRQQSEDPQEIYEATRTALYIAKDLAELLDGETDKIMEQIRDLEAKWWQYQQKDTP